VIPLKLTQNTIAVLVCLFCYAATFSTTPLRAEDAKAEESKTEAKADAKDEKKDEKKKEDPAYDFEHEEAFMDIPDALRSRQFVHRAILSTIIRDTAKVTLGSWYFTHLLGFNAVYQPSNRGALSFAKYVTGVLGVAIGYASQGGHLAEFGFDFSGVSNFFLAYRYLMKSEKYTFWPYIGAGLGMEMGPKLADVPIEAQVYAGQKQMGFLTVGAIVPLVDLALKVEARFNFFGLDRLMLTTGAGVMFFL
jgi:hypothetical protein